MAWPLLLLWECLDAVPRARHADPDCALGSSAPISQHLEAPLHAVEAARSGLVQHCLGPPEGRPVPEGLGFKSPGGPFLSLRLSPSKAGQGAGTPVPRGPCCGLQ